MNININKVKIIVTVPSEHVDNLRNTICEAGAGKIGNYTHCSILTKCIGTFKPLERANPYIGEKNKLEVQNKNILLFDDIYTTGNTVSECIKTLKKLNPKNIGVLTIFKD